MAEIVSALCVSCKAELWRGIHNVESDTFKFALYDSSATLNSATTNYTTTNEVSGTGYSAGGVSVSNLTVTSDGSSAIIDFDNPQWTSASFSADGGLLYNSTATDNPAISTYSFAGTKTASGGTFTATVPAAAAGTAVVEIDT